MSGFITIRNARLHNLKNIDLSIPKEKLVVLCGPSGSGKSSLGFDLLFKEGQRQYLESMGFLSFDLSRPPVDSITGLSPSISVDQFLTNRSPRSTVGTATDVYTCLRLLFAQLGHRPCPSCGKDVPPSFSASILDRESGTSADDPDIESESTFPCPHCKNAVRELGMAHFSFNKPAGACPTCTGLGIIEQADLRQLIDELKSIPGGAVKGWSSNYISYYSSIIKAAATHYGFEFDLSIPVKAYTDQQRDLLFFGVESQQFQHHFKNVSPPATVRKGRFEGVASMVLRRYAEHIQDPEYRQKISSQLIAQVCPDCNGTRLRSESRAVTIGNKSIVDISRLSISDLHTWQKEIHAKLIPEEARLAQPILSELDERMTQLIEAGAGYLTLERPSPSLSAGEAQRLRLASLLGSGLTGVLYVLDEPTIGTHPRDIKRLINLLRRLRDLGNTVLVIEHDLEMISAADYVIDFGPGGGKNGGHVVAAGTPEDVASKTGSPSGDYLAGRAEIPIPVKRRSMTGKEIVISGARCHNLKNITVKIPIGLFTTVAGVSGSGKSSLIFDILDRLVRKRVYGSSNIPGDHDSISGIEDIDRIITIDQEPAGRIPRSNAATYSEIFTPIREAFSATPDARSAGISSRHFSFNIPGGRCERCQGAGMLNVNMQFLPDAEVCCPSCRGRRFKTETLAIKFRGFDISQVLDLTIEEALELFADVPAARSRLQVLNDVGLGYLQLGQPTHTLSGGEAQRVKLARELGRRSTGGCLYLLDEPTTGLHLVDVKRLLGVLQRLVDAGNTMIVIEHNLELIKTADWIIELGPEGGDAGGELIAAGTPEDVAHHPASITGQFLRERMRL